VAEKYANAFAVLLMADIDADDTAIDVSAVAPAGVQSGEFRIRIDNEIMLVTAGQSTTTWTVERGMEGTTAAAHSNGATVEHKLTAGGLGAILNADLGAWPGAEGPSISASTWLPIFVAQAACVVRNVSIIPRAAVSGSTSHTWTGNLAVSRLIDNHPITAPPATDLIAARLIDGDSDNSWVQGQPWDWASVDWDEAQAHLLPDDVLGVYWTKTGSPSAIPEHAYSARVTAPPLV
jgi:hypothetical protein